VADREDGRGSVPGGTTREAAPGSSPGTVGRLPEAPPCPFCDGAETEIMNPFGSHASVATYWCRACRCPFEMLKWR
jgi:hypothetical protein